MQRCICGQSRRLPLCDGSHRSAGWQCGGPVQPVIAHVFAAGHHFPALALRLAHSRGGSALQQLDGPVRTAELVVITDGTDLSALLPDLARVHAQTTRLVVIGADADWVRGALPGARCVQVADTPDPTLLWTRIHAALDGPQAAPDAAPSPRLFLSHAVADEPRIISVVQTLRALGVDVFLCGDSIRSGVDWRGRIEDALRQADRFVYVLSQASKDSTWCAFEAGMATALRKPTQVLSLDETIPPSFLAHLQMDNIERTRKLRPWLNTDEAILEVLLGPGTTS